eukprot:gene10509-14490_t
MGRFNIHAALAYTGIVAVAPVYTGVWMLLRTATLPLPSKLYHALDDMLYASYQAYIRLYFELYTGTEDENALCIMNHQCTTDWFLMDLLGDFVGAVGRVRFVLKSGLRMLPWYGWYFEQHGGIFVSKKWAKDKEHIVKTLRSASAKEIPTWLVIFPEGTRFTPGDPEKNLRRRESARADNSRRSASLSTTEGGGTAVVPRDSPDLTEVLCPRVKGFAACVEGLEGHADAVYDMTVAYSVDGSFLRPANNPCMEAMMDGEYTQVHIHLKRHDAAVLPNDPVAVGNWLVDRFVEKDKLLQNFYKGKGFPGDVLETESRSGHILAHSAFWLGLLGITLSTKVGRQVYAAQVLFGGLGGSIASFLYLKATG